MALFSERYGYIKPDDVIIREQITPEIQNAICSCYDELKEAMTAYDILDYYTPLEEYLWRHFLGKRKSDFYLSRGGHYVVATHIINDKSFVWNRKLDLIDETFEYLKKKEIKYIQQFQDNLNEEFERLHFAYRVVDGCVVEVNSKEEIETIEEALTVNDTIRLHLNAALKKITENDYRNSIKESISAVEAINRQITGLTDWNLAAMEKKGLTIHPALKKSFNILFGYTNDGQTGIRHAQMDDEFAPSADDAIFMLVTCSAFINYLNKRLENIKI